MQNIVAASRSLQSNMNIIVALFTFCFVYEYIQEIIMSMHEHH